MSWIWIGLGIVLAGVVGLAVYDLIQRRHAILRNFPVIGHFRYWLEAVGPELRQYIVTSNNEERPFSRDQRTWVYASSKKENNYFGFGTDNELESAPGYIILKHSAMPLREAVEGEIGGGELHPIPCAKVLGEARGRAKAFRPESLVYVSAMSYGSLSAPAVEALNAGCGIAGALHNTGEGGVSDHHRHGGDLIWQLGTGYFGARDKDGRFSIDRLLETVASAPVRAIEIKLSQGAKPGLGGVLPAAKITEEISRIRGIPMGVDCISPPNHTEFHDVDSMLDFVEMIAERTGLPVGIKSAVGEEAFWVELCGRMGDGERGVDFITIDGGEGGTGAAPLTFADHVALPFKIGFARVHAIFAQRGVSDRVVWCGSGKLGFPENAVLAMALGCDMIGVAREAMLSIGCIQAQRCHSGHCPAGVATQNRWLVRGLDPTLKSARLANYVVTLRKELSRLSRACGVTHPSLITLDRIDLIQDSHASRSASDVFGYQPGWGLPSERDTRRLAELRIGGVPASGS
ncbi:MAG: FMN-binding glutamate synthase family protein [Phycisphaerales bacterium JB059]